MLNKNLLEDLMSSTSSDPRLFHQLIRKQRNTSDSATSSVKYNGVKYEGTDDVCKASYFQELGEPKESDLYDSKHPSNVDVDIASLEENKIANCLDCTPSIITVHEVDAQYAAVTLHST